MVLDDYSQEDLRLFSPGTSCSGLMHSLKQQTSMSEVIFIHTNAHNSDTKWNRGRQKTNKGRLIWNTCMLKNFVPKWNTHNAKKQMFLTIKNTHCTLTSTWAGLVLQPSKNFSKSGYFRLFWHKNFADNTVRSMIAIYNKLQWNSETLNIQTQKENVFL